MLILDHLTKKYGDFTALDGLSLEIADGQLHGFVGPNGAGKTTTMRILATLLKPTSGSASVNGADVVKNAAEARRNIGYMPDFFGVYDNLKCWEYLDFYGRCYSQSASDRKKMTERLLDLVQLTEKREAYVDSLSRGMKQRLCLARSLIHDPALLILDEPASGMDPRARAEMKGILRTLREMGKTVLISSHILPELSEMCDSLTILDHGELVFSGTVDELSDRMNGNAPLDIRLAETAGAEAVEEAVRCLREMPYITEILQEEPFLLRVRLEGGEDVCMAAMRELVTRNIPVCDFHRATMNLEKVFMEVTQDDA
jgi:ABC-2 type transport system ATP-binding protein